MHVDGTMMNVLVMITNVLNKGICLEDMVTSNIIIDYNTMNQGHLFIVCLAQIISELKNLS